MTDPFVEGVANPTNNIEASESSLNSELDETEVARKEAETRHQKAITGDVRANTNLKVGLSIFICCLIAGWFFGLFWYLDRYFDQMDALEQIIPEAVMLAVIGAGATIVGLMGFILKGLFKSN